MTSTLSPLDHRDLGGKSTRPLALAKLYDVSQRTPQGVQMAASTFAVIPTAVLFAVCHRKFKSSLSDMLVH